MRKKTIAVLFGGQSSEHEVSCLSAQTVIENLNEDLYEPLLIGITKEGHWLLVDDISSIRDGSWVNSDAMAVISPDASIHGAEIIRGSERSIVRLDAVFPVLHGLFGEDGSVQGLFELAQLPYVGCGVLSSAASMDKAFTKLIVEGLGISQAEWILVRRHELSQPDVVAARVEKSFPYPVFVKPANAGSSRGVSRVDDREGLVLALEIAAAEDRKILIERAILGRELECAVFRSASKTEVSGVGEILAAAEFYDYDAKYNSTESRTVTDPVLPDGKLEEIRCKSAAIFDALDCYGLSRVDFFLEDGTNEVIFSEINSIPGFTSISMYPKLWEVAGRSVKQLVTDLVESAFLRDFHQ